MSRSYKKYPIAKEENDQFYKKYYNRKLRRMSDLPNGSAYKKLHESWFISDYHWFTDDTYKNRIK